MIEGLPDESVLYSDEKGGLTCEIITVLLPDLGIASLLKERVGCRKLPNYRVTYRRNVHDFLRRFVQKSCT